MSRATLVLSILAVVFLAGESNAQLQRSDGNRMRSQRLQLIDAEFEVRMHELALQMSDLAEGEGEVELEKLKLKADAVKAGGTPHDTAHLELEIKQAVIRGRMRSTETDLARLRVAHAKARLKALKRSQDKEQEKPAAVPLEYDEGSDVVIIRGSKKSVEKIRTLIESVDKQK